MEHSNVLIYIKRSESIITKRHAVSAHVSARMCIAENILLPVKQFFPGAASFAWICTAL